jgi:hypothetical protein
MNRALDRNVTEEFAATGRVSEKSQMRLISFKPLVKGSLRGFATVQLPIGLTIEDCPVLVGRNGAWAALPAKPVLDREGRQVKPDGKPQYIPVLKWRDRDLTDRFSAAVVDLIRSQHPADLDGSGQ